MAQRYVLPTLVVIAGVAVGGASAHVFDSGSTGQAPHHVRHLASSDEPSGIQWFFIAIVIAILLGLFLVIAYLCKTRPSEKVGVMPMGGMMGVYPAGMTSAPQQPAPMMRPGVPTLPLGASSNGMTSQPSARAMALQTAATNGVTQPQQGAIALVMTPRGPQYVMMGNRPPALAPQQLGSYPSQSTAASMMSPMTAGQPSPRPAGAPMVRHPSGHVTAVNIQPSSHESGRMMAVESFHGHSFVDYGVNPSPVPTGSAAASSTATTPAVSTQPTQPRVRQLQSVQEESSLRSLSARFDNAGAAAVEEAPSPGLSRAESAKLLASPSATRLALPAHPVSHAPSNLPPVASQRGMSSRRIVSQRQVAASPAPSTPGNPINDPVSRIAIESIMTGGVPQ